MHSNLMSFARWFLAQPIAQLCPPDESISHYCLEADRPEGCAVTGVVLHRDGQFQVELFCILPTPDGVGFPEHAHPHVDSFEYLLSGSVVFTVQGKRASEQARAPRGVLLRVRRGASHGARAAPGGGTFLSIQRWYDVTPTSVGLDWAGPPHHSSAA